jgi:alpha-glucosidase
MTICLVCVPLFAGFEFLGNIKSQNVFPNRVEFKAANALFNIYVYDESVIRFRYTNQKEFSATPSYAVISELPAKTAFTFKDDGQYFTLATKTLSVQITKSPCRIAIYDVAGNLINADDESFGISFDNDEVRCHKKLLPGESYYGLGEKSDDLCKNGKEYSLWNTDYWAYDDRTDPLYISVPFFYGIRDFKAYGIFFDNTYKSHFNFGASNNRFYWFGAEKGEMDYYFIYGPEMKQVLTAYTNLTGRAELPPLWALGYQQSRWSYFPEADVRALAATFRTKRIPCDVIYFDIDYMEGYRVFTWNKERFPEPARMLGDLKKDGFKVIPIIDPGVKVDSNYFAAREGLAQNLFAKYPDGQVYQGEVWPSWAYFPDFTKAAARSWWGDNLARLLNDGVAGFWNDMNEPTVWGTHFPDIVQFDGNGFLTDHKRIRNVYALEMARATRDGLRKHSDQRHFVLTRAGFAGIQRYSAAWTGDNVANELHLRLACRMSQTIGLSGIPFIGSDVGGFIDNPSERLYIRWMELGVFTPLFRQHAAWDTRRKEPWTFGVDVENTVREFINLRYRLLPFLYNEFYTANQNGWPVMRPLFFNFQDDPECYRTEIQNQFMLGENLLVAPVLSEKEEFKRLYLPEGEWYDLNQKQFYTGRQWIIQAVPLKQIPWLLRAGGFLPMQAVQQYVGEKPITETEMLIYPAGESSYTLYEDDGVSYQYEQGAFTLTKFTCQASATGCDITVKRERTGYTPQRQNYLFKVISTRPPVRVSVGNRSLPFAKSADDLNRQTEGVFFAVADQMILIKTPDRGDFTVKIQYF